MKMNRKCRVTGALVVIGTLGMGLLSLSGRAAVTVAVMPDKVLYAPGEIAQFAVTVTNGTNASVQGVLEVRVIWEMDDSVKVKEESLALSPGETKVIHAAWPTADVLGCEVRAELVDGKQSIAAAADYFNVCPAKEMQRVGIHVGYPDLATFPEQNYLDTIPARVASLRLAYANLVEHFGWCPDMFTDLAPERDEWPSYWQSKKALRAAIAARRAFLLCQ